MFLPLGDAYSLDRALSSKKKERIGQSPYNVFNVATLTFHAQLVMMYYTANIHKSGPEWNELGTATWYALQYDFFRRPFAELFLLSPYLCKLLTWSVHGYQGVGWKLFFIPILNGPLKMFSVFGYFSMHVGFAASLRLGHFGWITCVAILAIIPTWGWETLFYFLKTQERNKFKLYYTTDHFLSRNLAKILQTFALVPGTEVIPYQVQLPSTSEERDDNYSVKRPSSFWLIAEDFNGKFYFNFEALLLASKLSPLLFIFYWFISKFTALHKILEKSFATIYYHTVTDSIEKVREDISGASFHRRQIGEYQVDVKTVFKLSYKISKIVFKNMIVGVFMFIIITWNFGNIGVREYSTPPDAQWIMWSFQLEQYWGVFAPRPPDSFWWYNMPGTLDNGTQVELWANAGLFTWEPNPMSWDKPNPVYISFKNHRWFKYFENGLNSHPNNDVLRLHFGRWICREYNKRHSGAERLFKFEIWLMNERIDGVKMDGSRIFMGKYNMWNHQCYTKE